MNYMNCYNAVLAMCRPFGMIFSQSWRTHRRRCCSKSCCRFLTLVPGIWWRAIYINLHSVLFGQLKSVSVECFPKTLQRHPRSAKHVCVEGPNRKGSTAGERRGLLFRGSAHTRPKCIGSFLALSQSPVLLPNAADMGPSAMEWFIFAYVCYCHAT